MALGATILTCRNRYVRDLKRREPFICQESAQNRSLDNKKSTLSEPKILSRIWEPCRAALAMSFGSHSCSSRSDFQMPTFHSFWWVGLLGCVLECGAIFGGYFFKAGGYFLALVLLCNEASHRTAGGGLCDSCNYSMDMWPEGPFQFMCRLYYRFTPPFKL